MSAAQALCHINGGKDCTKTSVQVRIGKKDHAVAGKLSAAALDGIARAHKKIVARAQQALCEVRPIDLHVGCTHHSKFRILHFVAD